MYSLYIYKLISLVCKIKELKFVICSATATKTECQPSPHHSPAGILHNLDLLAAALSVMPVRKQGGKDTVFLGLGVGWLYNLSNIYLGMPY